MATSATVSNNTAICMSSMFLYPVSNLEVINAIQQMPAKKSADVYGMSAWLLKQCYADIVQPFTELINLSFQEGTFPSVFKPSKVVPVYKKGNTTDMTNYRPISLLPIFGKLVEKIFYKRLSSFVEKQHILSNSQFGFRKNKCTIEAVNELVENVIKALDKKQKALSIFLDLSKAFDCVDHLKLFKILEHCGIRGIPLKWLKSYLCDRTQQVQINDALSDPIELKFGVPQGSILGPVLFILYVNSVHLLMANSHLVQYADDTTLTYTAQSLQELEINAFQSTNICVQFFEQLNLKTNINKSKLVYFNIGPGISSDAPLILLNNSPIEEVQYFNFLGIKLDKKFTWDIHIDHVCNKVSSGLYLLRNLSGYCSKDTL